MKLSIAAIVKNEADSLLEWVAYHRVVGVQEFFISDNDSTDGTSELLNALARSNANVHRLPFPTPPSGNAQMPSYAAMLKLATGRCDVVAFIDADEYIVPMQGGTSLLPLIERSFSDANVSALALNWAIFGSSGALFANDGLVLERFTHRAKIDFGVNYHIKSIVRPERVKKFLNPHLAELTGGQYINAIGAPLQHHPKHGKGLSDTIIWEGLRINHYATKSLEEFLIGKSRRGSAARRDKVKHKRYYLSHDRNDEQCLIAQGLAPLVWEEMERLKQSMAAEDQSLEESASGWRHWAHRIFHAGRGANSQ